MTPTRLFSASPGPRSSAGLATVATVMLLLLASLLAAAWAQRHSLNEIRSAASQARASSAFEAAEAGLAWTQAMLNGNRNIGADCQPSSSPGSSSFRSQYLNPADATGRFTPRTGGTSAATLKIACVSAAAGWSCSCATSAASDTAANDAIPTPMFLVELLANDKAGSIDVVSTGCSQIGNPCAANASRRAEAKARLRLTLAFLPTLTTPPAATLTTLGDIDAGAAALGIYNADALSGGLAAQAAGSIIGSLLRVGSVPGAVAGGALLQRDTALGDLSAGQFFSRHFASDLQNWKYQPGVSRLRCDGNCSTDLLQLIDASDDVARFAVEGDLRLDGPLQMASRTRPLVLVVDGDLLLSGPVQIHGVVYARRLQWDSAAAGTGALLHGAALLAAGYSGNAAPDLVYDPALMSRLQRRSGIWLRVPGSWKDF